MKMRPRDFRITLKRHTLKHGLVFFGGGAHAGSTRFHDSGLYGSAGELSLMDPATDWVVFPEIGRIGLDFDGTNDVVVVNKAFGAGDLTYAAWYKPSAVDSTTRTVCAVQNSGVDGGRMLRTTNANKMQFEIIGSAIKDATGATSISAGVAYHCCGVKDGVTGRLYLNGVQDGSVDLTGVTYTANLANFKIGKRADSDANYGKGVIADVMVWNRALSPSEIAILANRSDPMLGGLIEPVTPKTYWFVGGGVPPVTAASPALWMGIGM
jgi:hypothetical protein